MESFIGGATVRHWLTSVQLLQYLPNFTQGGYTELSQCVSLTEADLERVGVMEESHKNRLLRHLPPAKVAADSRNATGASPRIPKASSLPEKLPDEQEKPMRNVRPITTEGGEKEENDGFVSMNPTYQPSPVRFFGKDTTDEEEPPYVNHFWVNEEQQPPELPVRPDAEPERVNAGHAASAAEESQSPAVYKPPVPAPRKPQRGKLQSASSKDASATNSRNDTGRPTPSLTHQDAVEPIPDYLTLTSFDREDGSSSLLMYEVCRDEDGSKFASDSQGSSHQKDKAVQDSKEFFPSAGAERNREKKMNRVGEKGHNLETPQDSTLTRKCSLGHGSEASFDSEETPSEGGDFYDGHEQEMMTPIQIVPAEQKRVTAREGFLYKYASAQSKKKGWHKKWVKFDGRELRYYPSNKSPVSERIIPVNSMLDICQDVKTNEQRSFRFLLKTVDRVYTFATDDADDLAWWTNILMQAIMEKAQNAGEFCEGGTMARPDKEGLVGMRGTKGKLYMALKDDRCCYYTEYIDFVAGSPIHQIEMKLASVKECSKTELFLDTNYTHYVLVFDSCEEASQWKASFESAIAFALSDDSVMKEVLENPDNRFCADCGSPEAEWASVNLAITLCNKCAGVHRNLGSTISKVRSLKMDTSVWTPTVIQMMKEVGNKNANNFWKGNPSVECRHIDSETESQIRKTYIQEKYVEKRLCCFHPLHGDQKALNDALRKNARYGDTLEIMQLLFSGADIQSKGVGSQEETPLQLAKSAGRAVQMEFLRQNGADCLDRQTSVSKKSKPGNDISPSMRGYLNKTGPNQRGEFLRRYFVLGNGTLTYYENEQSAVSKDRIEVKEMRSVGITKDDRSEFTFELGTLKQDGRMYLLAANNAGDRMAWIVSLAKAFATISQQKLDEIREIDRGGIVSVKYGITGEWETKWMHLIYKTLYVYEKEEDEFEEWDLRKSLVSPPNITEGYALIVNSPAKKQSLYLRSDLRKDTDAWYNALHSASIMSGKEIWDQPLTRDNVPVLVDRCINFIDMLGSKHKGVYRESAQHSKVSAVLESLKADAHSVHPHLEECEINEVATALKRFFRQLSDPLMTSTLKSQWLATAALPDENARLPRYQQLLRDLPTVNQSTLKILLGHLDRVAQNVAQNKMDIPNIAIVFGPVLMNVDGESTETSPDFGKTTQLEITVIKDLLNNFNFLFEVKGPQLTLQRQISNAMQRILDLQENGEHKQDDALWIDVHVQTDIKQTTKIKLLATMTASQVVDYVVDKYGLRGQQQIFGLFEVICNEELQRPLHYSEKVLEVVLRWSEWHDNVRTGSHLCVKHNFVYDNIDLLTDPMSSLFGDLKFSELKKKGFKGYPFQFSHSKLSYKRDQKAPNPLEIWKVEDIVIYLGVQQKRSSRAKWGFTFVQKKPKDVSHKDSPLLGYSICCSNKHELYRWLAIMLHAQHPEGLLSDIVDTDVYCDLGQ